MKRIAVVEDEVYMREELCSMLEKAGYSVLEITAFENAEEQLTAITPDLVILISTCLKSVVFRFAGISSRKPHSCSCFDFQRPDGRRITCPPAWGGRISDKALP